MKEINIEGRILQYETVSSNDGWADSSMVTKFYEGEEEFWEKKFIIFGEREIKKRPKFLFEIFADTQNDRLSKEWWREKIKNELSLLNRRAELDKNELI